MNLIALKEASPETRVALTPGVISHYTNRNLSVFIESGAGLQAGFSDESYAKSGIDVPGNKKYLLKEANIVVCFDILELSDLKKLQPDTLIIGSISKELTDKRLQYCEKNNIDIISMNYIPRISRAQNIDSLSSQASLAGYRAIIEATTYFNRALPMMMTAAGMIHPAKVLVLGAGVAGLQAIATAKRLGAQVFAFDVRTSSKEQVESLGGEFIAVETDEDNETQGGYAKEMSEAYKQKQRELLEQYVALSDIVICTALIPDKQAPVLITKAMVESMKPNTVIVDLAAGRGGNCELSQNKKTIKHHDVTIIGESNLAGKIAATASELYANNVLNLIKLIVDKNGEMEIDSSDAIFQDSMLLKQGKWMPFQSKEKTHA